MDKNHHGPSWAAIILWFIFFWPVGLYFLLRKLMTDKEAAVKMDRKAPMMGWLLLFAGIFFISSYISGGGYGRFMPVMAMFFLFGGILSLSAAKRGNLEGFRFRCYIDAIVNRGMCSFQDIAGYAQVSVKTVSKDLKRMVRMGYFDHAHIDEKRGEIHIFQRWEHEHTAYSHYNGNAGQAYNDRPYGSQPYDKPDGQAFGSGTGKAYDSPSPSHANNTEGITGSVEKMLTCPNCGANNWITPGTRNYCEFCGSPISSVLP